VTRPAENQQTVEALERHIDFCDHMSDETRDVLRAALRDLVAQAEAAEPLAELEEAVSAVLGTLNFYTGPGARTAVSRESIAKYDRVKNARDQARSVLARLDGAR